jgi:hypothetical protein
MSTVSDNIDLRLLLRQFGRIEHLLKELIARDGDNLVFRADTRASFGEIERRLDDVSDRLAALEARP